MTGEAKRVPRPELRPPLTSTRSTAAGVALALGALAVMGLVAYRSIWGPWLAYRGSNDWVEVPCVVTHAEKRPARDDNVMWAFDLEYDYAFAGERRVGTRYSFWNEVVSRSPADLPTIKLGPSSCWIDPDQPSAAVLSRSVASHFGAVAWGVTVGFALFAFIISTGVGSALSRLRRVG